MSQNGDIPKLTPEQRLEIIKRELPLGTTQDRIGEMCGVCRETISRQVRAWELSGGFEDWIRREFRDLFYELKDDDKPLTFKEISKLAARTMTQRTEATIQGFELRVWQPGREEDKAEPAE